MEHGRRVEELTVIGEFLSAPIVIHEGVQALDVAGPIDVFAEANRFLDAGAGYEINIIGREARPMRASSQLNMTPDLDFAGAASVFGTALVAGGPALPEGVEDRALSAWLRDWGVKAQRYGSICTGALAVGHAGLLDDRAATTHWQNAGRLAAMFPRVHRLRPYISARRSFGYVRRRDGGD
jgi:transcriptional regulator GlxA family with amidase domain